MPKAKNLLVMESSCKENWEEGGIQVVLAKGNWGKQKKTHPVLSALFSYGCVNTVSFMAAGGRNGLSSTEHCGFKGALSCQDVRRKSH